MEFWTLAGLERKLRDQEAAYSAQIPPHLVHSFVHAIYLVKEFVALKMHAFGELYAMCYPVTLSGNPRLDGYFSQFRDGQSPQDGSTTYRRPTAGARLALK